MIPQQCLNLTLKDDGLVEADVIFLSLVNATHPLQIMFAPQSETIYITDNGGNCDNVANIF